MYFETSKWVHENRRLTASRENRSPDGPKHSECFGLLVEVPWVDPTRWRQLCARNSNRGRGYR